jgi:aldehyde dehydrogenase (NAD(P)+)
MQNLPTLAECQASLDRDLQTLADHRSRWVQTSVAERIAILNEIKDAVLPVAQAWSEKASRQKGIPVGSPLECEEWLSGPYTVMAYCNQMMATLSKVQGKQHLSGLPLRVTDQGVSD